ncbi:hypothetical protein C8R45DRAFT_947760 [Mycena sanguinolenta]|nr:hypothetical protein C8R45DRAFT_947760 [Mycena sanguinolenta]
MFPLDRVKRPSPPALIFVALESLATTGFGNLFRDPELTRVAVDEIHECSTTAHWRPAWDTVRQLTDRVVMQFLLLSGSVRFGHESCLIAEQKTRVVFFTSHGHNYHTSTELDGDPDCIVEGAEMLNSKQGCFRSFGRAFNGKGHTCDMLPHAPKCQRCAPHTPLFVELEQLAAPFRNAGPLCRSSGLAHHYSPYPRDTGTARAEHRRPLDEPVSRVRAIPYN